MWKVIKDHIKNNPALCQTVVLALTLGVLIWQTCLTTGEIKIRQRPFFGLTKPEVEFLDKDPDDNKHEIFFTMNFENKGPVPANDIEIKQKLYFVKEDQKIKEPKTELFNHYEAKGISILPNQTYPKHYMEHLNTFRNKLFHKYGEPTKPGFLYIHTYISYHGIKEKPKYFQETLYSFEWVPAHTKKGVFHLLRSTSN